MINDKTKFEQTETGQISEDWEIITSGIKDKQQADSITEIFGDNVKINGYQKRSLDQHDVIQFIVRHFDIIGFAISYPLGKVLDKIAGWFKMNDKTGTVWAMFSVKQGKKSVSFNIHASDKNLDKIIKFVDDNMIRQEFDASKNKTIISIAEDKKTEEIKIQKI